MSKVDHLSDLVKSQSLRYVEFLVFICLISHQIYLKTKQQSLPLHEKVDAVLEPLFRAIDEYKRFTFAKKADESDHGSEVDEMELDQEIANNQYY